MKLNVSLLTNSDEIYVIASCDKLSISEFFVFDYHKFNKYYNVNGITDLNKLTEDLADTIINLQCIPYNRQELIDNLSISIFSNIIKYVL